MAVTSGAAGALGIDISPAGGMEIYSPTGNVAGGGGNNFAYLVTSEDNGATFQLRTIPDLDAVIDGGVDGGGDIAAPTAGVSASFGNFPAGFEPINGFAIVEAPELTPPAGATGYAYNATGQLFSFPLTNPAAVTPIGPAGNGTDVKGLDFRPGTFNLFSISVGAAASQLGLVNISTGGVTNVGAGFPNTDNVVPMLATYSVDPASQFGFDFNPTTVQSDGSIRVRLVDDGGTNLRLNDQTGGVASVDGDINIAGTTVTGVSGAAYTNSDTGRMGAAVTPTRLFYLDASADRLLTSPSANAGDSLAVGALGSNVDANSGFDILSFGGYNVGYVTVDAGGTGIYTLNTIDLQTGRLSTPIGTFPVGFTPVNGFSLAVLPVAPPVVIAPDTTRPRVVTKKISRKKTVRDARSRFMLRGKAIDDTTVTQVLVKEKGEKFKEANGTRNWRFRLRLDPGRNPVRIVALDASGNRSRVKRIVITREKPVTPAATPAPGSLDD